MLIIPFLYPLFIQDSTFQAVLTSDGCFTYAMYVYEECAIFWDKNSTKRGTDNAMVGFTNGRELNHIELQGDYQPHKRNQRPGIL